MTEVILGNNWVSDNGITSTQYPPLDDVEKRLEEVAKFNLEFRSDLEENPASVSQGSSRDVAYSFPQTPSLQFENEPNFDGHQSTSTYSRHQGQQRQLDQHQDMNTHDHTDLLSANNNGGQQLNNQNVLPYSTNSYDDLHLVANEVSNLNAIYEQQNRPDFRSFQQAQLQGQDQLVEPRYPSPTPINGHPYIQQEQQLEQEQVQQQVQQQQQDALQNGRMDVHMEAKSESDAASPGRSKPIAKPERPVTKNQSGQYQCDWEGCNEEIKTFSRKCEWS